MTQQVRFERVYEDHATDRISTHVVGQRGRSIELHVQHHGDEEYTNYTLGLYLRVVTNIAGDLCLEVRPRNLAETGPGLKPATTLIQLTPDERMFR